MCGVLSEEDFNGPFERLIFIFSARQFRVLMFSDPVKVMPQLMLTYLRYLVRVFKPAEIALMLVGLISLIKKRRNEGLLIVSALAVMLIFLINYAVGDIYVFYIPTYILLALAFSFGCTMLLEGFAWILGFIKGLTAKWKSRIKGLATTIMLIAFTVPSVFWVRESVSAKHIVFVPEEFADFPYPINNPDRPHAKALLLVDKLEDNAIVFAHWDKLYTYYYVAHIEQGRTGIAFHDAYPEEEVVDLSESALEYIRANLSNRPIYFTVLLSEVSRYYELQLINSDLSLYRISNPAHDLK